MILIINGIQATGIQYTGCLMPRQNFQNVVKIENMKFHISLTQLYESRNTARQIHNGPKLVIFVSAIAISINTLTRHKPENTTKGWF